MSDALNNLPPEMQARLAAIMAGQGQPEAEKPAEPTSFLGSMKQAHEKEMQQVMQQQQAPIAKPPSLMDHVIALRQEVAALRQESAAQSNVVDAVGQAVGQLYQMFQPSSQPHAQGQTYSQAFQQSVDNDGQDF